MNTETVRSIFEKICNMQDSLNYLINPNWKSQNANFRLAASQEMAELIDCYPWKWWKKHEASPFYQTQLEVIDIAHFLIADMLMVFSKPEIVASFLTDSFSATRLPKSTNEQEIINELYAQHRKILTASSLHMGGVICDLMHLHDIGLEMFNKTYLSKNCLNIFRLKNGYREGSYQKQWLVPNSSNTSFTLREDNVFLENIVNGIDDWTKPHIADHLFKRLEEDYLQYGRRAECV